MFIEEEEKNINTKIIDNSKNWFVATLHTMFSDLLEKFKYWEQDIQTNFEEEELVR